MALIAGGEPAINAGINRLLEHDYAGCIIQRDLMICPFAPDRGETSSRSAPTASPTSTKPTETSTRPAAPPTPPPSDPGDKTGILIVDDNTGAKDGEKSEAAIYLTVLTQAGYSPELWVTGDSGIPDVAELARYAWVIWSDAGYESSGIDGDALRVISAHMTSGGHVTISSRMPFFGVGAQTPSPVRDVVVVDGVPELTAGLPKDPILLNEESPPLSPFDSAPEPSTGARMAMDRGPASGSPGAPILMVFSDENYVEPKGALLMLFGLSVGWLPNDVAAQLIENMAEFMLKG
ncbi:MAG: hypothetical protein IPK16_18060 [Anaerolineales bacterium]|nr:hypothetical protein [Anaerolineales bacterium]